MRRILPSGCRAALFAATVLPPRPAAAEPDAAPPPAEALALSWDGPGECPDTPRVRRAVEAYLGRPTENRADASTRVEVKVSRPEPGHWVAALTIETPSGAANRGLDAGRCNVLADATALIVALAIDPTVAGRQVDTGLVTEEPEPDEANATDPGPEPTPPAPGTTVPDEPGPAPAAETSPESARRKKRPTRVALRIAGGFGVPHLGSPGGGVFGAVGVLRPRLRVEAHAGHWFARPIRDAGDTLGEARLTVGGVRVCPVFTVAPLELPVCAGGELGAMFGRANRVDEPGQDRLLWAAFTLGPALMYAPVRYLAITLQPELVVPVSRPRFLVEGRGEVLGAPPAAFQVQLGVEARFP